MRTLTDANLRPTRILDFDSPIIGAIARRFDASDALTYLRFAHEFLRNEVAPVYTVDELQPTSVTIQKKKGSCSQRFACLESLARAVGIPTRVRALQIAGKFWAPRFPFAHIFIPRTITLALPQFQIDDTWLNVEELFGSTHTLATQNPRAFANDSESIFDAMHHAAIDFDGKTANCADGQCDLSRFARGEQQIFNFRDELFNSLPLFQHTLRGRAFEWLYGGKKSR